MKIINAYKLSEVMIVVYGNVVMVAEAPQIAEKPQNEASVLSAKE